MFNPKYTWLAVAIAAATLTAACGDDSGSSSSKKDPAKTTCSSNTDCKDAAKPFCNTETGACEADPGTTDPNACPEGCGDNQKCVEGRCEDIESAGCKSDGDCKDASAPKCNTQTGACEAAPAEPDPNACPQGCPENQKCVEGACVDGNPCTGMDCEDGKACIPVNATGMCIDVECVRDNALMECDAGKVCQKGECVLEACAKVTCNQGKLCQADGTCAFDSDPALVVDPVASKETSEAGGEISIDLKLNHEPASDVSLKCEIISASPNPEAAALCEDVLFNAAHWNEAQSIKLYGIADSIVDGDQAFELKITTVSEDPEFNGLTFSETFTNKDSDKAEILVSRSEIQTSESGDAATFTVTLSSKPSANVTLSLASSNPEFGKIENAENNSLTLTFTPENWNVPQTVTVTGVEDDGTHNKTPNAYTINFTKSVSEDAHYNDKQLDPIQATNLDNDKAEVFVSVVQKQPCGNLVGEGDEPQAEDDPECVDGYKEVVLDREFDENQLLVIHTDELNTVANLRLRLGIAPTMPVDLSITAWDDIKASGKAEADTEAVFSTEKITLTKDNYKAGELLTVSGKPDHIVDPDQPYYIRIRIASDDDEYDKLEPIWIKCINANTDHFEFVKATESSNTVDEDSEVNAEKPSVEYDLSFACDPQDSVTVTFGIEDETELKVSPKEMTFTSENWNTPQKLKIDGKIDEIVDGDIVSKITLKAKGENTDVEATDEIELTTVDINKAGINVAAVGGSYREGSEDVITFEVWLNAKPQAESVVVSMVSSNPSALSIVGNATLVFTPENWDTHKTVTLKVGADVEENEYVRINLTSFTDEEEAFNKLTAVTPDYVIIDTSGAAVSLASAKTVLKPGDYVSSVDVSLSQDPLGTLTVTLLTTNDKTAAVEPKTLTFTSADWSIKQTVQVKVVDANGAPSAKSVETISAITSTSGPYNKVKPKKDVNFTIYQFLEKSFAYTGAVQTIDLKPGKYLYEVWGAQGSNAFAAGGLGGYASGQYTVDNAGTWYVYVGGHTDTDQGGWNGGGGGNHTGGAAVYRGSGGGGSDIRSRKDDLQSRVIVAGGGGGSINYCGVPLVGAYGGGLTSGPLMRQHLHATESSNNIGANQNGTYVNNDPGVVCTSSVVPVNISAGSLGKGAQGGGGGYYGGAFYGSCNLIYTGAGGSGYIGGVQNGQMKSNIRSGHGAAKITFIDE